MFCWQGLGLEPVAVNAVYVAGPLGIAVSALLAQKLSLCIGRIQTCLLCRGIGIGLLVAIAYVQSAAIVLPLYLLRTWLMNCTAGLTKSVLNDYVAKANRGKWNSLESINLFGWSGSAALGGDFGFTDDFNLFGKKMSFSGDDLLGGGYSPGGFNAQPRMQRAGSRD